MIFFRWFYMLYRMIALPLHRAVQSGRPVLLQGPRSAGKTTLLEREFPGHTYVSLDAAVDRLRAREDPERFVGRLRGPAIIDDAHRAPELAAWLVESGFDGPLVLVSSRRLALPVETLELYGPTLAEREGRPPVSLEMLGRFAPAARMARAAHPEWAVRRGFVEHDVRDLVRIHEPDRFSAFLLAVEGQSGEILDQQAIADETGLAHRTVARWLAVLEACFQVLLLPAAVGFRFGRRLVRSPKLHLLASEVFESRVISEIYRNAHHGGERPALSHWRDSNGFSIPLVVEAEAAGPMPVGIAENPTPAEAGGVRRWMQLARVTQGALIGGTRAGPKAGGVVRYSVDQL